MNRLVLSVLAFAFVSLEVRADSPDTNQDQSAILFVRRIAPLLREKCVACHGGDPESFEGSLDVRSSKSLTQGGDSGGPAVHPGKPDVSPLYLAARRDHDDWSAMPPKEAEQLNQQQLIWLRGWIATGAAWPDENRQKELEAEYADKWAAEDGIAIGTSGGLSSDWTNRKYERDALWAYQEVGKIDLSRAEATSHNPIDFLVEELVPKGLGVAMPATRRELIRRATFDLTGLPPTPKEVTAFVMDGRSDADAFADAIDRLLKSPHYGERMAQHWLDVVRYADSSGFANDFERGNAWRYRDYVVRSFNADKPYDQFVREQIAGDEIDSDNPESIVAAGFLRMGPWELTGMEVPKVARQRFLDDVTNSVGETFLGHSLQCARCHDHKFDPVPTRDYYSIQAVFATTQLAEREAEFLECEDVRGFDDEQQLLQRRRQAYVDILVQLNEFLLRNAQQWFAEHPDSPQKETWDEAVAKAEAEKRHDSFDFVRNRLRKQGISEDEIPPKLVGFTPEQFGNHRVARKGMVRLQWEVDRYKPFALSVYNGHTPKLTNVQSPLRIPDDRRDGELESPCILTGGDPFASGPPVQPGTLSVIDRLVSAKIPMDMEGRRTAFANWVASSDNPLTTRVIVNRVWQWHFGKAIASNPNNFGSTGGRPTHPRLLDYLASTFIEDGWSIKSLHRRIMLSRAYQRSCSHPDPRQLEELDPLGKYFAVFQPRRLSAEELRDSMLAVTGELNPALGGIPCRPEINVEVAMQPRMVMGTFAAAWVPSPRPQQRHRRSIYALKLRGLMYPMLEVFNSPAPDFSCERREASTVTPQVFSLFNSQNTYSRALALANRVWREVEKMTDENRGDAAITRCFELAFGRKPSKPELKEFVSHWQRIESALPENARPSLPVPLKVERRAVEENTGERFTFEEPLFSNEQFVPDLQPGDVDRHVRALGDVCLVILNSNEFVYVF